MVDILKCHECGSIVQVLADNGSECSLHMQKIPVQTEGENAAKHKPIIEIDGDIVTVKIGKVTHPMEDNHYIQYTVLLMISYNPRYFLINLSLAAVARLSFAVLKTFILLSPSLLS